MNTQNEVATVEIVKEAPKGVVVPERGKYALPADVKDGLIGVFTLEPDYKVTPGPKDKFGAAEFSPGVVFPMKFADWGISEERLSKLLAGFVCAHHVQSGLKSAWKSEKRNEKQKHLLAMEVDGVPMWGPDFVPTERTAKLDAVGETIMEKFDGWKAAGKLELAAERIGMAFNAWESAEEMLEAYLQHKAEKKNPLADL